MCERESDTKETCHTPPTKVSSDFLDQWSVLDSIDEETLKRLIREFGLELQHELPELKGSLYLTVNIGEEEDPER